MLKEILFFCVLLVFYSCKEKTAKNVDETITNNNVSTTYSSDTAKLARLINLKVFQPIRVKFKYSFIDNSSANERLSIPGPSDDYLEAVLYFDAITFSKIKKRYSGAAQNQPKFNKQDFNFSWLDKDIKDELLNKDTSYNGTRDYFFGSVILGKVWFLDNKILLASSSN